MPLFSRALNDLGLKVCGSKRVISRLYLIKVWHIVEAVTLVSSKDGLAAGYKGSGGPQVCSFDVGFCCFIK